MEIIGWLILFVYVIGIIGLGIKINKMFFEEVESAKKEWDEQIRNKRK